MYWFIFLTMVLYQDLTVAINLVDDSNIICVTWFDQAGFKKSDFEFAFFILIENLERYQVKNLIVKISKTMMQLPDEEFQSIILLLQSGLAHSKVQKIARIMIDHSARESWCKEYFRNLMNDLQLKIKFRNFENRAAALAWLSKE